MAAAGVDALAAFRGIAACVSADGLRPGHILPFAYDQSAHDSVAKAVREAAIATGVSKLHR